MHRPRCSARLSCGAGADQVDAVPLACGDQELGTHVGRIGQMLGWGQILGGQRRVDRLDPHGFMHAGLSRVRMDEEPWRTLVAGLGEMDQVADPLPAATAAEPGIGVVGRLDAVIRATSAQRPLPDGRAPAVPWTTRRRRDPFVVPGPHAPQHGDGRQCLQGGRRVGPVERVQQRVAVSPDLKRIGVTFGRGLGQADALHPLVIALVPIRRRDSAWPLRRGGGDRVQGRPQRFAHQFQPVQRTDGSEDVSAVRALPPTRLEQPLLARRLQHAAKQPFGGPVLEQPAAEFA
jgi:hypothetical protein